MNQDYENLLIKLDKNILKFAGKAIAMSDDIARHPELSCEEFRTSALMVDFLKEAGFSTEYPFMEIPTAYRGEEGTSGPIVALLAEYDALPGIGHACGHCLSGSMSTLAAAALRPFVKDLGGRLWIVGTPAEETNGAKVTMSNAGLFDDVSLAAMIHADSDRSLVRYRSLAMDALEFSFEGKTSHAAGAPWDGINALNGVQLLFHSIDMLRQHVIPEIRMHGVITNGGDAPNIVPQNAKASFYFRAPSRKILNELLEKVYNCARGSAMATGTSVSWRNVEFSFDEVRKNEPSESMMEEVFRELKVPFDPPRGAMGSSDIGNVSQRCPALQPELSIMENHAAHHTVEFAEAVTTEQAHEALITGAKLLARAALKTWMDKDLRQRMREELEH